MAAPGGDPRVADLLGAAVRKGEPARVVLVGFPCDVGVGRNGGRIGAAGGPAAIREVFGRLTPDPERFDAFTGLLAHTMDIGDVEIGGSLEADQARLGDLLAPHLAAGRLVVVLGGGHETAYGHFLAYARAGVQVEIVNIDAHPDVRPLKCNVGGSKRSLGHSGSPFRQALLHPSGSLQSYTVAGLLRWSASREHISFVMDHGGRCIFARDLSPGIIDDLYAETGPALLATFDLDALSGTIAPGVSAPAAGGIQLHQWLAAARAAGASSRTCSMDICELNPRLDRDHQTARVAALTLWTFFGGLLERDPESTAGSGAGALQICG